MPAVVQGWLRAVGLSDEELVELIFTDQEILLRRPISRELRDWAKGTADSYDKAFRQIAGL
jgi:arsenate reductase-like glutaredoxin family protein